MFVEGAYIQTEIEQWSEKADISCTDRVLIPPNYIERERQ